MSRWLMTGGSPVLRFAVGHLNHAHYFGVQLQGGVLAAPDRAGGDGMHAMADEQAQRAPVAADDLQVALGAAGDFVPGIQAGLLRAGRVLLLERDPPARRAVAHAGEDVDDRALAVQAIEAGRPRRPVRSEEHTSELQSLMRISYAVFCLKKKKIKQKQQ